MNRILSPTKHARSSEPEAASNCNPQRVLTWMSDSDGRCIDANRHAAGYFVLGESLDAAPWNGLIHSEDRERVRKLTSAERRQERDYQVEYRVLAPEGKVLWKLEAGAPRHAETGEFLGYSVTIADITALHLECDFLVATEATHRFLTENSMDMISHLDADGTVLYVTSSIRQILGFDPSEIVGTNVFDQLHPDDTDTISEHIASQLDTRSGSMRLEFRKRHKNGHYVWLSSTLNILIDARSNALAGIVSVCRDASFERQTKDELRQREERFRSLTNLSSDWYWETDEQGCFSFVSDSVERVFGIPADKLLGKPCVGIVLEKDKPELDKYFAKVSRREPFRDIRYSAYVRSRNAIRHAAISGEPIFENGLFKGYRGVGRDVTERYLAKVELQKSKHQLSTVLESIADAFFTLDNEWRVTYVNQRTAEFVSRRKEELLGKIVWEAVPEFRSSSVLPYYQNAMETRSTVFFEGYWEPTKSWADIRIYPNEDGLAVFFHDITARRESENAVRASEQRLREMIEMTPAGYAVIDAKSTLLEVNLALCKMSGYSHDELIGAPYSRLFSNFPKQETLFNRGAVNWIHGREGMLRHKDGHTVHVLVNANVKRDCDGSAKAVTAFLTEITERKLAEERLHQLANHDILTGLPNRNFLNTRLQQILDNLRPQENVAVMFIDLDRFKEVNDTMGHDPGDMLLREVAIRLQSIMRPSDMVARLGGDEFIVVANCTHGRSAAAVIADKLLAALSASFSIENQEVFVTASIGISIFPEDGKSKEQLFKNADMAMYSAKDAGRNSFRFFEAEMSEAARMRMKLENSLHHALSRNEFELHYQPRIDLKTMQVVGVETLIRWNHPELGRVPPLQFIPIAEESGMIEAIGHWVLQKSCRELRRLIDRTGRNLRLSVNVSARQLKSKALVEQVQSILQEANLPSHLLELELTETALMENMDISADILEELKVLGVMLAVDDFGTGYSGLAYLQRFPLDVLKLDRSFVNENAEGAKNLKFIKAFLDLAHALNLSVVAEGIETLDILNTLLEFSCDEGQGYLFAKPLPADELEIFLTQSEFSMREV